MLLLFPLMEAVRSGGDLENVGGSGPYCKDIVCPDGCVLFRLTAKSWETRTFSKEIFWTEPDKKRLCANAQGRFFSKFYAS